MHIMLAHSSAVDIQFHCSMKFGICMCRLQIKRGVPVNVHTFHYFDTGKPIIGDIVDQKGHYATFSDPPFLQNADYGEYIKLTKFTVMCRSHGQEEESSANLTYTVSPTSEASPTQPHQVKLTGLKPGKKYKLTVTAHYSNGESIPSEPRDFSTKPAGECMYPTIHDFSIKHVKHGYTPVVKLHHQHSGTIPTS